MPPPLRLSCEIMKKTLVAIAAASTLALTACASDEGDTSASPDNPPSPSDVEWYTNEHVTSPPEMTTTNCESRVVEVEGESYTLKGASWEVSDDGDMDLDFHVAPRTSAYSTFSGSAPFENGTLTVHEAPQSGMSESWLKISGERELELPTSSSLHSFGTSVPASLGEGLGAPNFASATINGESIGTCHF